MDVIAGAQSFAAHVTHMHTALHTHKRGNSNKHLKHNSVVFLTYSVVFLGTVFNKG